MPKYNQIEWYCVCGIVYHVLMPVKSFLKLIFFCYYDLPTLNKAYLILSKVKAIVT